MSIHKSAEFSSECKSPLSEAASLMGKKGGPAAARIRFSKMTPEERQEHGRKLSTARWEKQCPGEAQEKHQCCRVALTRK